MGTSNVTQKGQVTIPADMRKALGLNAGSKVRFRRRGRTVELERVEEAGVDSLFGTVKVPRSRGIPDIDAAVEETRMARSAPTGRARRK